MTLSTFTPAAELLGRLVEELRLCRGHVRRIEDGFLQSLATKSDGNNALQGIDLLDQSLDGISDWIADFAQTLPREIHADAAATAARIKLGDMRLRLIGLPPDQSAESGGIDLF